MATPPSVAPILAQAQLHSRHGENMAEIIQRRGALVGQLGPAIDQGLKTVALEKTKRTQLAIDEKDNQLVADAIQLIAAGHGEPKDLLSLFGRIRSPMARQNLAVGIESLNQAKRDVREDKMAEARIAASKAASIASRATAAKATASIQSDALAASIKAQHDMIKMTTERLKQSALAREISVERNQDLGAAYATSELGAMSLSGNYDPEALVRSIVSVIQSNSPGMSPEMVQVRVQAGIDQVTKTLDKMGNIPGFPGFKARVEHEASVWEGRLAKTNEGRVDTAIDIATALAELKDADGWGALAELMGLDTGKKKEEKKEVDPTSDTNVMSMLDRLGDKLDALGRTLIPVEPTSEAR